MDGTSANSGKLLWFAEQNNGFCIQNLLQSYKITKLPSYSESVPNAKILSSSQYGLFACTILQLDRQLQIWKLNHHWLTLNNEDLKNVNYTNEKWQKNLEKKSISK